MLLLVGADCQERSRQALVGTLVGQALRNLSRPEMLQHVAVGLALDL